MKKLITILFIYLILIALIPSLVESPQSLSQKPHHYDNPSKFAEHESLIRTREGDLSPRYPTNYKINELEKHSKSSHGLRTFQVPYHFTERGPFNVPGRTRDIIVLPGDSLDQTWIAATVGGGIWSTNDGGSTWIDRTSNFPNLSTTTLDFCRDSANILYAGTGESFAGSQFANTGINGNGIYKSIDSGENWFVLESTLKNPHFGNVNRIIVDFQDPNTVFAATSGGLFNSNQSNITNTIEKSTDGGQTWSTIFESSTKIEQIMFDPRNDSIIYGSINTLGMIKSTDRGMTWHTIDLGLDATGRIEFDISLVNPNRLMASIDDEFTNKSAVFISHNAGSSWGKVIDQENNEIDYLGGQGFYDNTILFHPFNEDIAYVGGVNLWKIEIQDKELFDVRLREENTSEFLSFMDFNGTYSHGRLGQGTIEESKLKEVEIRFGEGRSQKAHRFTVNRLGAGVEDEGYFYQDYVSVPFEVWEKDTERQLMVSFRDQQEDGTFTLKIEEINDNDPTNDSREYIYIHDSDYEDTPHVGIAKKGGSNQGHKFDLMYFFWPVRYCCGEISELSQAPGSTLFIEKGIKEDKVAINTNISDAYGEISLKNRYLQRIGRKTHTGIHPDHHRLKIANKDTSTFEFRLLAANDGGVYVSKLSTSPGEKDGDWIYKGNGLITSQFYSADKKPGEYEYIGGMQDNGTWRSPIQEISSSQTSYVRQLGGDGFEVIWHSQDPKKILASSRNNFLSVTFDGGLRWLEINNIENDNKAPFFTKLESSPQSPDLVYAVGESGVWKTTDFGIHWEATRISNRWTSKNVNLSSYNVEVSDANEQIVMAGGRMTANHRIFLSKDGGSTFSETSLYQQETLGAISGIASHPNNEGVFYLLFSIAEAPKVLQTVDYGDTWTDLSGFEGNKTSSNGFPDVAAYSLLVFPDDTNRIWIGTDIGLIESSDNGESWHLLEGNIPNTSIYDMKIVDNEVVIATHGRGIWTMNLSPEIPQALSAYTSIDGKATIDASASISYDSIIVKANTSTLVKIGQSPVGRFKIELPFSSDTSVSIRLIGYIGDSAFASDSLLFDFFTLMGEVKELRSDFDNSEMFFENGLKIKSHEGFQPFGVHSDHPYNSNSKEYLYLRPIITVDDDSSNIRYDEVVLIENESESTIEDFVSVQASKNGRDWITLIKYDSRGNQKWESEIKDGKTGDSTMFASRYIDLRSHFVPFERIMLRWSMVSDEAINNWGFAMDNLSIQNEESIAKVETITVEKFRLFPNPVQSTFQIMSVEKSKNQQTSIITIFNSTGQVLFSDTYQLGTLIDISNYRRGVYYVKLGEKTPLLTQKLIKL